MLSSTTPYVLFHSTVYPTVLKKCQRKRPPRQATGGEAVLLLSRSCSRQLWDVAEEAKKLIGTGNRHLVMEMLFLLSVSSRTPAACWLQSMGTRQRSVARPSSCVGSPSWSLPGWKHVLGNALEGVPEESEEEDQPNSSNIESANNLDVNGVEKSPGAPVNAVAERSTAATGVKDSGEQNDKKTNGNPEEEEDNGESKPEDEQDEEESEGNDDDDDEDGEQNGQEEEEVGNLQLAWEMLEVAKVIYKKKEGKDDQLMAAQTYLKLGEVSAESALDDFQECLALQLKHLPPPAACWLRPTTTSPPHCATWTSTARPSSTTTAQLKSSRPVWEAIDAAGGAAEEKNEMDELKQLLPDIKEKVEDAKESQRTGSTASQAIQQTLGGASTSSSAFSCGNGGPSSSSASAFATVGKIPVKSSGSASSSKAVSNISHLVRKKETRGGSPVKDTDAKQAKQEATVNGSGDSSASNGKGPASSSAAVGSSA
ncbi:hypothetical protein F7725_027964 [Dissostichus mawsoni]|uniref:Tetratricopeptide SHNi-TPR domain-containing protein n=1 Tax=Dissostichus mawsoni TaxID=36200 RepID=A0A7J5XED9_DISMA|nr:hypothetical protein F7725_027964 [Dissostichus mawsoni]